MVTILLTYYNRQAILNRTLQSFLKYDPKDFDVIVVDNGSDIPVEIPALPYRVTKVRINHKKYGHQVYSYNIGFQEVKSDIVIFQGAEMYHYGNILERAKLITDKEYISFGVYSLGQNETPESFTFNNKCMTFDGESAWYNHPVYRPVAYPFCSALTTGNIKKLNGLDERFLNCCGFEDNYFVHQTKMLGLKTIITTDPIALHQWHNPSGHPTEPWQRGKALYETLRKTTEYRAEHRVTPDL
jgi:glycosyltransferase involved in cell wall biosynthesis